MLQCLYITLVPAVCMALGSAAVTMSEPSEKTKARMQYLSAGLLLGAITTDIFPILKDQLFVRSSSADKKMLNGANAVAAFVGASVGLFIMYSIKAFAGEDDDDVASMASGQSNKVAPQGQLTAAALAEPLNPNRGGDSDDSVPPTPRSQAEEGRWFEPEDLEESDDLKDKCKRLAKQTEDLSKVVQADTINRDALDERIHQLDFAVDSARRACRGADHMM